METYAAAQAIIDPSLLHWEPTVQAFRNISEEAFRGKEKLKFPSVHNDAASSSSFPTGSRVGCYYGKTESVAELHWRGGSLGAVVQDSTTSDHSNKILVTFLEDGFTTWLPSDWCMGLEPKTVWEAEPFMYHLWFNWHNGDPPFSEFHLAFQSLSNEFPDASPAMFTYWQGRNTVEQQVLLGKDESTMVETEWNAVDPRLTAYMEQNHPSVPVYHALTRNQTITIDDKYFLYQLYQADELAASVFPPTFGSIEEALEATDDSNELFFLKDRGASQGRGIRVLPRHELLNEPKQAWPPSFVVQRAIQDILTIDHGPLQGRRFDIRYFVVVCRGKVYLHSNMYAMWSSGKPFDPNDPSVENQVPKVMQYEPGKELQRFRDFLFFPAAGSLWNTEKSYECKGVPASTPSLDPMSWREEIAISLSKAKSTLAPLINATASDPLSYHMVGADAIMERSSGRAVLIEYNDWPDYSSFHIGRKRCLDNEQLCSRRLVMPTSDGNYVLLTRTSAELYSTESGYTAQVLQDMAALVMGLESPENLERFREIKEWTESTDTCVQS